MVLSRRAILFLCLAGSATVFSGPGKALPAVSGGIEFVAVGDVLLDRSIRNTLENVGADHLFDGVKSDLTEARLVFFNLECPLCDPASGCFIPKRFRFRGDPELAASLRRAGFTAAGVANNHTIDRGRDAFQETLGHLRAAGVAAVGGGENQSAAYQPAWVNQDGLRVALFGFLAFLPEGLVFSEGEPGPAIGDPERFTAAIRAVRQRADVIIVSFHWGQEGSAIPDSRQEEWAKRAVDAGADLVFGHHPHVLQPVAAYRGAIILYSLGNFLFDNRRPDQRSTVMFRCRLERGRICDPRFVPVVAAEDHRPVRAIGENRRSMLQFLAKSSEEHGIQIDVETGHIFPVPKGLAAEGAATRPRPPEGFADRPFRVWEGDFGRFEVYPGGLQWASVDGQRTATFPLGRPGELIRDACLACDGDRLRVYAILGPPKAAYGARLAVFPLDLTTGRFETPLLDAHEHYSPWKVRLADVDGDGKSELLLGVYKSTRYDSRIARRLFVYTRAGDAIFPKWLGSRLGGDLVDFEPEKGSNAPRADILADEAVGAVLRTIRRRYSWNGFGFSGQPDPDLRREMKAPPK